MLGDWSMRGASLRLGLERCTAVRNGQEYKYTQHPQTEDARNERKRTRTIQCLIIPYHFHPHNCASCVAFIHWFTFASQIDQVPNPRVAKIKNKEHGEKRRGDRT